MNDVPDDRRLVSVALPTFNRAHLLPRVLESILGQDVDDLELLLLDHGSKDETKEVVAKFARHDERLRLISVDRSHGLGFVRQVGLEQARGKYLAFADSDDVWLQGRLRKQLEVLERHREVDLVFGDFWDIDLRTGTRRRGFDSNAGLSKLDVEQLEDGVMLVIGGMEVGLLLSNFVAMPTLVGRTASLQSIGCFLGWSMSPDLEFCWRAAVLGLTFSYLAGPLIERNIHPDSLSARGERPYLERLRVHRVMYETARLVDRADLVHEVRRSEARTYLQLMRVRWWQGEHRQAIRAFFSSFRLVPGLKSVLLLIRTLCTGRTR